MQRHEDRIAVIEAEIAAIVAADTERMQAWIDGDEGAPPCPSFERLALARRRLAEARAGATDA